MKSHICFISVLALTLLCSTTFGQPAITKASADTSKAIADTSKATFDLGGYLTGKLNGFSVTPSVLAKADYKAGDWRIRALILGLQANPDTSLEKNASYVLIPEASIASFNARAEYDFRLLLEEPLKKTFVSFFANSILSIDLFYSLKNFASQDSLKTPRQVDLFQGKIGLEIMLARGLAIYGNFNYLRAVANVSNFSKIFDAQNPTIYRYFDGGFKADFGKGLFLDLSFIKLTDDLRKLRQTPDDVVIPFIRIGFNHNVIGF